MANQMPKTPAGAGVGPVYSRKSPWMTADGVDYHTSNVVDNDGPAGHKQWSDRGWADDYADNTAQAQGYRQSPPWRPADFIQDEQRHYYTHPDPVLPDMLLSRYAANSTRDVDRIPAELLVGMAGNVQVQTSIHRAPDARWFDIPEAFQSKSMHPENNLTNATGSPVIPSPGWRLM